MQAKEYNPNESIVDMMKTEGSRGWNVGAFGAIVKDGKIADGYGGNKAWKNDPNEKTGRTIFLELNDGTQSILTVDGHASKKTGVDHDQIVQILKNIGLDKIKLAFALDGGGSTRSYAKTDSGNESIVGSFVDNRPLGEFLYLTKNPTATPGVRTEKNADKVAKNESKSVDYNMFIEARNAGKEKIPGTNYDTGITYKDETKTDKVPFTTVYKANPNTEAGKKSTIQKGEDGVVTTKVTTKYVDGVKGDSKSGTPETTKQAKDEVVEVGTKTKVETKTIPFERVTRDNDQLKQGETKIVQTGKDGKQTVTTTYELNTKTGEVIPKETTQNEPMTPEIVERGTMKPVETKPSETKPSDKPKASDKKDEIKPSEVKPSETKPSETPKSSDKKDEAKPSETKPSDKKDEVKPSETKKPDNSDNSKQSDSKPELTDKSETKKSDNSDNSKPKLTDKSDKADNLDKPKVNESIPKSDNLDKPEVNKSIPESKSEEKSDVKPDGQSSSLDNKSVNSSASQSAQNSAKQDLPKTNDVKVPLTISGIVLATAGFVALGYRKFFGKN